MPFRRSERIKSPESSPPSWPPDIDSVAAQQSNDMERSLRGLAIDGGAQPGWGRGGGGGVSPGGEVRAWPRDVTCGCENGFGDFWAAVQVGPTSTRCMPNNFWWFVKNKSLRKGIMSSFTQTK